MYGFRISLVRKVEKDLPRMACMCWIVSVLLLYILRLVQPISALFGMLVLVTPTQKLSRFSWKAWILIIVKHVFLESITKLFFQNNLPFIMSALTLFILMSGLLLAPLEINSSTLLLLLMKNQNICGWLFCLQRVMYLRLSLSSTTMYLLSMVLRLRYYEVIMEGNIWATSLRSIWQSNGSVIKQHVLTPLSKMML